jgi:hypothetical protein
VAQSENLAFLRVFSGLRGGASRLSSLQFQGVAAVRVPFEQALVIGERVSVDPDKLTLHDRATDFVYVYASVATISPVNRYQV